MKMLPMAGCADRSDPDAATEKIILQLQLPSGVTLTSERIVSVGAQQFRKSARASSASCKRGPNEAQSDHIAPFLPWGPAS